MFLEVFALRRPRNSGRPDPLLDRLAKVERQLQQWISSSAKNAALFQRDPVGGMRAAGLDIEDDIMLELELITKAIARKLE